ncbi:unnamed protein product [Phytophthora lilii]|uniref:Unnamed protein product n=1 Tax=Phytophthora lilii TaxID=2077276 RepID=A0A9W6U674_9STRA|nr:unnamed protein product [Phytophthora lilii]
MRRPGADDVAFSAYSADTEDYYAFLPSDESMSDDPPSPAAAQKRDPVDELASVFASSSSIDAARKVMTPIGGLDGSRARHKETKSSRQQVKAPAPGVFDLGGGEELRVSPRALEQHNARRTQLQEALDAATDRMSDDDNGEAPFRFVAQLKRVVRFEDEMEVSGASPAPVTERVEGHAPEKKSLGRRPSGGREEEDSDEDEAVEPDPLYDEQLDDADAQWVETNLREFAGVGTVLEG